MRSPNLFFTGVATLSLAALLTACGGGGGGGNKEQTPTPDPVGTLTFSGAASGKYVVNPTHPSNSSMVSGGSTTIALHGTNPATFVIGFSYPTAGTAVTSAEVGVGSPSVGYGCNPCINTALEKADRKLTFTNTPFTAIGGAILYVTGTVTWQ